MTNSFILCFTIIKYFKIKFIKIYSQISFFLYINVIIYVHVKNIKKKHINSWMYFIDLMDCCILRENLKSNISLLYIWFCPIQWEYFIFKNNIMRVSTHVTLFIILFYNVIIIIFYLTLWSFCYAYLYLILII